MSESPQLVAVLEALRAGAGALVSWVRHDHSGRMAALLVLAFLSSWLRERVPRSREARGLSRRITVAAAEVAVEPAISVALSTGLAYLAAWVAGDAAIDHLWRQALAAGLAAVAVSWSAGAGQALAARRLVRREEIRAATEAVPIRRVG